MTDTRRALLDALADGPVSGPALADRLGVSRAAVWKQVEALREAGFGVESTDEGYHVTDVPEFGGDAVAFGLDAPFEIEFHDAIPSTNDRARELADEGAENVAVVANEQIAGRGRLERDWTGPSGGIYCSLLIRPGRPVAHAPIYTLAAAVAVTRAAREAGVDARIKWPNDVVVEDPEEPRGGRKLCGILTEMEGEADRVDWLVVGVGVNANVDETRRVSSANQNAERSSDVDESRRLSSANQKSSISGDVPTAQLPEGATSLQQERGEQVDRRLFTQRLLETFHELRQDPDAILDAWREHAATIGQRVRVETPGGEVIGEAVDVEFPGALVVETDDGDRKRVTAGDCEHLRPV